MSGLSGAWRERTLALGMGPGQTVVRSAGVRKTLEVSRHVVESPIKFDALLLAALALIWRTKTF